MATPVSSTLVADARALLSQDPTLGDYVSDQCAGVLDSAPLDAILPERCTAEVAQLVQHRRRLARARREMNQCEVGNADCVESVRAFIAGTRQSLQHSLFRQRTAMECTRIFGEPARGADACVAAAQYFVPSLAVFDQQHGQDVADQFTRLTHLFLTSTAKSLYGQRSTVDWVATKSYVGAKLADYVELNDMLGDRDVIALPEFMDAVQLERDALTEVSAARARERQAQIAGHVQQCLAVWHNFVDTDHPEVQALRGVIGDQRLEWLEPMVAEALATFAGRYLTETGTLPFVPSRMVAHVLRTIRVELLKTQAESAAK